MTPEWHKFLAILIVVAYGFTLYFRHLYRLRELWWIHAFFLGIFYFTLSPLGYDTFVYRDLFHSQGMYRFGPFWDGVNVFVHDAWAVNLFYIGVGWLLASAVSLYFQDPVLRQLGVFGTLFLPACLLEAIGVMRQGCAMGLVMLSLYFINARRYVLCFAVSILAIICHASAIVPLLVLHAINLLVSRRQLTWKFMVGICALFIIFSLNSFYAFIGAGDLGALVTGYTDSYLGKIDQGDGSGQMMALMWVVLSALAFLDRRTGKLSLIGKASAIIVMVGYPIFIGYGGDSARIIWYFTPFVVPCLLFAAHDRIGRKRGVFIYVCLVMLVFSYYIFLSNQSEYADISWLG